MKHYNVFVRTWYKETKDKQWPGGLEPHLGRKTMLRQRVTFEEARKICEEYNSSNNPGRLGRKAEFESA
jgi:hypothetical protein